MKMKRSIAVSESGFVFNPNTGESFSTNPIGLEIVMLLKEPHKLEDILDFICSKYLASEFTVEKDVDDFIHLLTRFDLLEQDEKTED